MKENTDSSLNLKLSEFDFFLKTWSGRILIVNIIVFILMSISGQALMQPSSETLLSFGALDVSRFPDGEWWRLGTPIFVHVGLIHFAFNSYALKYIGPPIEAMFGGTVFLFLYFSTGILGNVAAASHHVIMGAGASGAIFGLIGAGIVVETLVRQKLPREQRRSRSTYGYTSLAGINLLLGIFVPGIDNAAHIGGLLSGICLGAAWLLLTKNRLLKWSPATALFLVVLLLSAAGIAASHRLSRMAIIERFIAEGTHFADEYNGESESEEKLRAAQKSYHFYSKAIELDEKSLAARFGRGRILMLAGDRNASFVDFAKLESDPNQGFLILGLVKDLKNLGRFSDAIALQEVFLQGGT